MKLIKIKPTEFYRESYPFMKVAMQSVFVLFMAFCCVFSASAQTFSIYAGTGSAGYSGDGGNRLLAQLNSNWGLTIDHTLGRLYVADFNNTAVRTIDMGTDVITTYAGDGTGIPGFSGDGGAAVSARLKNPTGVTVDGSGNLYIYDINNHRIRMVDGSGTINTIIGNGISGYSGDGGPATAASIGRSNGLAVTSGGTVYLPDYVSEKMRTISPSTITTSGTINFYAGSTAGYAGDGLAAGTASAFNLLNDAKYDDATGNLYISDWTNNVIRKVDGSTSVLSTFAGSGTYGYSTGVAATSADLRGPMGFDLDCFGNLFFCDVDNHVIRRIDAATGMISTVAGTPGTSGTGSPQNPQFNRPVGLVLDAIGDLYISDRNNNRIVKLAFDAAICEGKTLALCDKTGSGTWSSSNTSVATVSSSGVVTGVASGTAVVTLNLGTYFLVKTITVNPAPAPITGPTSVTIGGVITLSNATAGGAWTSSDAAIATVDASGNVTGVSAGVVTITYTLPGGCYETYTVEVKKRGPCIDDATLNVMSYTDSKGNCVFSVTANVTTAYLVMGYEWTLPDGSTVITHTSASSDIQTFTLPAGGAGVVQVRILVVRSDWEAGETPCCEITLQEQVSCDGKNPCDTMMEPTVTCWGQQDTVQPYGWKFGFVSSHPVTVDFVVYVFDMSTASICTLTVSLPIPAGTTTLDPCTLPGFGACGFPCTPGVFITYLQTSAIHYQNCTWQHDCSAISNKSAPGGNASSSQLPAHRNFSVTPNPTNGTIKIEGEIANVKGGEVTIEIVDMLGQAVYAKKSAVADGRINDKIELENHLANGMYVVRVRGEKSTESVRFTLRR